MLKTIKSVLIVCAATLAFSANAVESTIEVKSSDLVHLSNDEALSKVFHVRIPDDSVVTLAINGSDRFSTVKETDASITAEIDGKVAFFTFNTVGQYAIGASTICGVAFSVVVDVYKDEETAENLKKSLPKVVIDAPKNCSL